MNDEMCGHGATGKRKVTLERIVEIRAALSQSPKVSLMASWVSRDSEGKPVCRFVDAESEKIGPFGPSRDEVLQLLDEVFALRLLRDTARECVILAMVGASDETILGGIAILENAIKSTDEILDR